MQEGKDARMKKKETSRFVLKVKKFNVTCCSNILLIILLIIITVPIIVISASGQVNITKSEKTKYEFIKGKGVSVCEEYYRNLLSFHIYEIICGRTFKSKFKSFKEADWEELNLDEYFMAVRRIRKFISYGDQYEPDKEMYNEKLFIEGLKEDEENGWSKMQYAKLDIANNGMRENVILYSNGECLYSKTYARPIIILNVDNSMIDVVKTDMVLQNVPDQIPNKAKSENINYDDIKTKAKNSMGNIYDVFTYKNKIYFDKWNADYSRLYNIIIYKIENGKTEKICEYECLNACIR